jgi:predicted transglutaminase-like cysteine proteinase
MFHKKMVVSLIYIMVSLSCGAWDRMPAPTTAIAVLGVAEPPAGYNAFCKTYQVECAPLQNHDGDRSEGPISTTSPRYWRQIFRNSDHPTPSTDKTPASQSAQQATPPNGPESKAIPRIVLDRNVWATLNRINRAVNDSIRSPSDPESFRQAAHWVLAVSETDNHVGNCKDAAIEKRHQLIAAGIPSAALAIAVVRTLNDQAHAVLVFHAQTGDYVLDSAGPWISSWHELNYRWISMETPNSPTRWSAVRVPMASPSAQVE